MPGHYKTKTKQAALKKKVSAKKGSTTKKVTGSTTRKVTQGALVHKHGSGNWQSVLVPKKKKKK